MRTVAADSAGSLPCKSRMWRADERTASAVVMRCSAGRPIIRRVQSIIAANTTNTMIGTIDVDEYAITAAVPQLHCAARRCWTTGMSSSAQNSMTFSIAGSSCGATPGQSISTAPPIV
jgi:hypothetical protein